MHGADDLAKLTKLVRGCCGQRTRKARPPNVSPAAAREPFPSTVELPFSVTFNRLVLSQNRTTYSHWNVHHKDKHDWLSRVQLQFAPLRNVRIYWSSWQLTRVYSGRRRELDYANLVGGAKPLIDSLIDCGIVKDDSPTHFLCGYDQERGESDATILTLVEMKIDRDSP